DLLQPQPAARCSPTLRTDPAYAAVWADLDTATGKPAGIRGLLSRQRCSGDRPWSGPQPAAVLSDLLAVTAPQPRRGAGATDDRTYPREQTRPAIERRAPTPGVQGQQRRLLGPQPGSPDPLRLAARLAHAGLPTRRASLRSQPLRARPGGWRSAASHGSAGAHHAICRRPLPHRAALSTQ